MVRVMEMTSTRNSRSVDRKLEKLPGQGISYAVDPDARICQYTPRQS